VAHKSGKLVHAWAFQGDCDPSAIRSNTFKMEWPPRSGLVKEYPEVDRADFFDLAGAKDRMHRDELPLVERLATWCKENGLLAAGD
jgi:predicted NUDIX family NTP pyrophosphohydrolase